MMFCTVQDVADFLQIEVSEPSATRAIEAASAAIQNYCHQHLALVEDDEFTFDVPEGHSKIFLPELPVISVASVVEDGETLVEDEDYKLGNWGILYRLNGNWASGVQIVTVTYTHGYEEIPDDIVDVATRAASRAYQAGLRAAELDGVPGVVAMSLGDYSVSFGAEGGGGVSEGIIGASAARMLLLSEKDILNRYR